MIPAPLGHLAYRLAYLALRIWSAILHPHTRGVKCVVCAGDEILLVRHSYGPRWWDLPGGFVQRKEDFAGAARRELAEELAVGATARFTDLGELRRDVLGRHETLHGFRVDLVEKEGEIQGFELLRIAWHRRDDLPVRRAPIVDEILELDGRFACS